MTGEGVPDRAPRPGTTYRTAAGDMVDLVCWQAYGTTRGTVETVLEANRGLADHGTVLGAGVAIVLPVIEVAPLGVRGGVRLWG